MTQCESIPCNTGTVEDAWSVPGLGRSPGGGNSNPFQYSYLGNPMHRGIWWATSMGSQRAGHDWAAKQEHRCFFCNFYITISHPQRQISNLLHVLYSFSLLTFFNSYSTRYFLHPFGNSTWLLQLIVQTSEWLSSVLDFVIQSVQCN